MNRQPVRIELELRGGGIEHDVVATAAVLQAGEAVGPRIQERDPHELALAGVGAHAGALPQQLLTAMHQRRAEHPRARQPRPVQVGAVVVEHARRAALDLGRLDAVAAGHHSTATGFRGEPVPPTIRSGAAVNMNSQRPVRSQASRRSSSCR